MLAGPFCCKRGCVTPHWTAPRWWRFCLGTRNYNVTTKWCAEPGVFDPHPRFWEPFLKILWYDDAKGFYAWNSCRLGRCVVHAVIGHSPLCSVIRISTQSFNLLSQHKRPLNSYSSFSLHLETHRPTSRGPGFIAGPDTDGFRASD